MATTASVNTTPASLPTTKVVSPGYPYMSTCVYKKFISPEEQKYCDCAKKSFENRKDPKLNKIINKSRNEMTLYLRESNTKILILILVIIVIILMVLVTVIYMSK